MKNDSTTPKSANWIEKLEKELIANGAVKDCGEGCFIYIKSNFRGKLEPECDDEGISPEEDG